MIEMLKVNTTLTELDLSREEYKYFREADKNNEEQLTESGIGAAAQSMYEMLKVNTTLTSLELWCKKKDHEGKT